MYARIALILRPAIIWLAQAGLTAIGFTLVESLLDKILETIKEHYELDDDDTRIAVANNLLDAFAFAGIGAGVIASKMPIKLAKKLGFADGKPVKRKLSAKGEAKVKAKDGVSVKGTKLSNKEVQSVGESIALKRGLKALTVVGVLSLVMSVVSITSNLILAAANVMDFGNWQGAYQKTFQKIFTSLGFPPDSPMPKARTLSAETWQRIWATIETLDPIAIAYPISGIDKPYSRDNLANLIDEIAANLVKDGEQATYKNVIGIALPLIQLKGQPDITKMDKVDFSKTSVSSGGSSTSVKVIDKQQSGITTLSAYYALKGQALPSMVERAKKYQELGLGQSAYYTGTAEQNTKLLNALLGLGINNGLTLGVNGANTNTTPVQVVTGILSQGTIGSTTDFISRQDDLIENEEELKQAMHNNLAPFISSLGGRVTYEVRIVSSISTATGFQQKGSVQRIVTGYTTKGVPKYKNVYNKFAVLDMKIKTATGSMAKLATIVLGPVDSVKFTASNINLNGVAQSVQQNIIAPIQSTERVPSVSNVVADGEAKNMTIQDIVKKGYTIEQAYRLIGGPNHNNGANYVAYYGNLEAAANAFAFKADLNRQPEPMTVEYIMSLGYPIEEARYIVNGGSAYMDPTSSLYTGSEPS